MSKNESRVQVGARVEKRVYKEFKKLCVDRDSSVRDAVEKLMIKSIDAVKRKGN